MKNATLLPLLFLAATAVAPTVSAQEGTVATQALVRAVSKDNAQPTVSTLTVKLDGHATPLTSLEPVAPATTQVALLIDDGLSRSSGIQLNDIKAFVNSLPPATEVLIGYMANGRIETLIPFTADHQAAAAKVRLPSGIPGISASPYFCVSDFVKHWPGDDSGVSNPLHKARFVMLITNGVDPYNGSTSILNQDSPYVQAAIVDAQRAGVVVSSIYYRDAGFRGGSGSLSGQSYLQQVAQATGGESYYQGSFTPPSLSPYFKEFEADMAKTYIATFEARADGGGREHLVQLKIESNVPKQKIRHPDEVRPGNKETATPAAQ